MHIEVLNHALLNIPGDRVRMHVCWGNYEGPHICDIALAKVCFLYWWISAALDYFFHI